MSLERSTMPKANGSHRKTPITPTLRIAIFARE